MFTLSGFKVRSGQVNPKTIKLFLDTSHLITSHLGMKAANGWLRIRIMCPK
jgi:hypothetical protein